MGAHFLAFELWWRLRVSPEDHEIQVPSLVPHSELLAESLCPVTCLLGCPTPGIPCLLSRPPAFDYSALVLPNSTSSIKPFHPRFFQIS